MRWRTFYLDKVTISITVAKLEPHCLHPALVVSCLASEFSSKNNKFTIIHSYSFDICGTHLSSTVRGSLSEDQKTVFWRRIEGM